MFILMPLHWGEVLEEINITGGNKFRSVASAVSGTGSSRSVSSSSAVRNVSGRSKARGVGGGGSVGGVSGSGKVGC